MLRSSPVEYTEKNAIMLQPYGMGTDDNSCRIYYDLLKSIFEPFADSEVGLFLVQNHIDRFRLNGSRFTECILDVCADIVNLYKSGFNDIESIFRHYQGKRFDNIMGYICLEYLKEHFKNRSIKELADFCTLVVILDAFYGKQNLDPQLHETPQGTVMTVPEGVDAQLLAKVLAKPEMAALLTSLAKTMGK